VHNPDYPKIRAFKKVNFIYEFISIKFFFEKHITKLIELYTKKGVFYSIPNILSFKDSFTLFFFKVNSKYSSLETLKSIQKGLV
jgi:hypothetical protein